MSIDIPDGGSALESFANHKAFAFKSNDSDDLDDGDSSSGSENKDDEEAHHDAPNKREHDKDRFLSEWIQHEQEQFLCKSGSSEILISGHCIVEECRWSMY